MEADVGLEAEVWSDARGKCGHPQAEARCVGASFPFSSSPNTFSLSLSLPLFLLSCCVAHGPREDGMRGKEALMPLARFE